jgi:catechol 2,3-dioxygenase-like lactoylglutathione lyase family enzyme
MPARINREKEKNRMKRFHVHMAVEDIEQNVSFYSTLFGTGPMVRKPDYAKSNKYWVQDPQGVAWEAFHTLGEVPVFGEGTMTGQSAMPGIKAACCAPA